MRAVLDTNILVSGLLNRRGHCGQIVDLLNEGVLTACVDHRVRAEYEDVLRRSRLGIPSAEDEQVLLIIRTAGEVVTPAPLSARLPHPSDLPFLEVAAAAEVPLVTGNVRHFPRGQRAGVNLLSPTELLDLLRRKRGDQTHPER
jgi:predicted nucleic acid-binding protein